MNCLEANRKRVAIHQAKKKITIQEKWDKIYGQDCALHYREDVRYEEEQFLKLGRMDLKCVHCGALKFADETKGLCCRDGKVELPKLSSLSFFLKNLLLKSDKESKQFRKNIVKFNALFQMTSLGAKTAMLPGYQPTFRIHGQIHHRIGSLLHDPNEEPQFLQIYFLGDETDELDCRTKKYPELDKSLISRLQCMLKAKNQYCKEYVMASERLKHGEDIQILIRADRKPAGAHSGRYNVPAVIEVSNYFVEYLSFYYFLKKF